MDTKLRGLLTLRGTGVSVTDPNLRRSIAEAAALVRRRQRKLEEIRRALVAGDERQALAAMRAFFELPDPSQSEPASPPAQPGEE